MQCSCCGQQSDNLREYSRSAIGPNNRKTIATLQLCAVCRILYRIKPQLVIGHGGLQIMLQFALVTETRCHARLEKADRVAPFGLGAVECDVGIGQKRRRVVPVGRRTRNADAHADTHLSSRDLDVADKGRPQLLRELTGGRGLRLAEQHRDELVAPTRARKASPATRFSRRVTSHSSASPTGWP